MKMNPLNSIKRDLERDFKPIAEGFECPNLESIDIKLQKKMICNEGYPWFRYCRGNWRNCQLYRNQWMMHLSEAKRAMFIAENNIKIATKINKGLDLKQCSKCGASIYSSYKSDRDICYSCMVDDENDP